MKTTLISVLTIVIFFTTSQISYAASTASISATLKAAEKLPVIFTYNSGIVKHNNLVCTYNSKANDTIRKIAKEKLQLENSTDDIVVLNRYLYPKLDADSILKIGTYLRLPCPKDPNNQTKFQPLAKTNLILNIKEGSIPIPGVKVSLDFGQISKISNLAGDVKFDGIPTGTHIVSIAIGPFNGKSTIQVTGLNGENEIHKLDVRLINLAPTKLLLGSIVTLFFGVVIWLLTKHRLSSRNRKGQEIELHVHKTVKKFSQQFD